MSSQKSVFLFLSASVYHSGHIRIIDRAAGLGELTVALLSDKGEDEFGIRPTVPFEERARLLRTLKGVSDVIEATSLDCTSELRALRPDVVAHGDDWKIGRLAPVRAKTLETLAEWGGELVEFPYTSDLYSPQLIDDDQRSLRVMSMPEMRRPRLREMLASYDRPIRVMEAHNGLTGLIVEKTEVEVGGEKRSFDAIWVSSLTDSTAKGKPDTELVDNTSRLDTIEQIMEVTTKPIILDGDSGGLVEHFQYLVATLERIGVSAVIIEDKVGLKRNSLFGLAGGQDQDDIPHFCEKITAGKKVQKTHDFLIIARIESLILEKGMDDALERARAYVRAGADAIMIHSRRKEPDEVAEFCRLFKAEFPDVPVVVVPTSYNHVPESELGAYGADIVIHANHLIRSAFPAMQRTAESILENGCSLAADEYCMPIKEILTLIPAASD